MYYALAYIWGSPSSWALSVTRSEKALVLSSTLLENLVESWLSSSLMACIGWRVID